MARRRTLRPDEEELWQAVARSAQPLHPQRIRSHTPKPDPLPHAPEPRAQVPAFPHFHVGEKVRHASGHDLVPALRDQLAAQPLRMDAKSFARMSRGKLSPEARIDLHGMTLTEAHPELIRFILNAHADGLRLVLVITGKGSRRVDDHGPIPQRPGVLRHQVPHWLRMPPLGAAVLQVAMAHLKHGGEGAYYVYLRRPR
ncbi:Smr/MutS family protein [Cereibacter azotoformans]|uniref:Smr/MutS family protein n=1 Tax=Cereibacter azotoformans TaxID=43057 RepID=UPI003B21F7D4